mmetsp:Transcript_18767/g.28553  ORF Transcript_18767/g.28553 Transcript_18767/m.28553 type:complete len:188 (-) Transcript_18767:139-702(-)
MLQAELSAASGVGSVVTGEVMFNSMTQMQVFDTIEMTPTYRYMSTISMIAPSPDWFTGYYSVDFVNSETGTWYSEVEISTYPWDAGTEEGDSFDTENDDTDPHEAILRFGPSTVPSNGVFLNSAGGDDVLPMASWRCTLQGPPTSMPTAMPTAMPTEDSNCPPGGPFPIRLVICFVRSIVSRIIGLF